MQPWKTWCISWNEPFQRQLGKVTEEESDYETMTNRGVKGCGRHRWYDTPLSTDSRRRLRGDGL